MIRATGGRRSVMGLTGMVGEGWGLLSLDIRKECRGLAFFN